ncbi:MAG: hypothetical protein ACWGSQ_12070, partial [Longimicrobiales bacterium]
MAPCPRYGECDGCALQHLEYSRQCRWKGRIVGDALRRIGGLDAEDPPVEPSPRELAYRNKATMTLRRLGGGRVVAGFRQLADRRRILDLGPECLLLMPELARIWGDLRSAWGPDADLLPQGRELRLTLRVGGAEGALLVRGGRGDVGVAVLAAGQAHHHPGRRVDAPEIGARDLQVDAVAPAA